MGLSRHVGYTRRLGSSTRPALTRIQCRFGAKRIGLWSIVGAYLSLIGVLEANRGFSMTLVLSPLICAQCTDNHTDSPQLCHCRSSFNAREEGPCILYSLMMTAVKNDRLHLSFNFSAASCYYRSDDFAALPYCKAVPTVLSLIPHDLLPRQH